MRLPKYGRRMDLEPSQVKSGTLIDCYRCASYIGQLLSTKCDTSREKTHGLPELGPEFLERISMCWKCKGENPF